MTSPRLEASIRYHFSPILKSDGFSGSGRTFRRILGSVIHVVNVQGAREGGKFAVNLGIQPLCIPDVLGAVPNPTRITAELCEFRRRLCESKGDQWWEHEASKASMDAAVQQAAAVYTAIGRNLFFEQSGPVAALHRLTPEQFADGHYSLSGFGSTKVRMARSLALMRRSAGNLRDASAFADIALSNLGSARGLRQELELLRSSTEATEGAERTTIP
jgi:hypothetical protein